MTASLKRPKLWVSATIYKWTETQRYVDYKSLSLGSVGVSHPPLLTGLTGC